MEQRAAVQRWVVNISEWKPSSNDFSLTMSFLPQHEHCSITRFVKLEDRKRALVSRLLQYAIIHQVLGIPYDDIIIERTAEGKPFLVCNDLKSDVPNFNFNASHHGDYVAIASETVCLVGLDIVSHSVPVNESAEKFIQTFSSYFSSLEWHHITNAGSSGEVLKTFYRYWCLKEAFVKAIGTGVCYKLDHVEFHHRNWDDIKVKVAGNVWKDWKFWLQNLGENHSVAIARGNPKAATASYRIRTLKQVDFDENEYNCALRSPNPAFTFLTVDDLVRLLHRSYVDRSRKLCPSDEDEKEKRST